MDVYTSMCVYIYIYIYIHVRRAALELPAGRRRRAVGEHEVLPVVRRVRKRPLRHVAPGAHVEERHVLAAHLHEGGEGRALRVGDPCVLHVLIRLHVVVIENPL